MALQAFTLAVFALANLSLVPTCPKNRKDRGLLRFPETGILTLYNVCAVPWGVFSTVGGYHEYRGGIS